MQRPILNPALGMMDVEAPEAPPPPPGGWIGRVLAAVKFVFGRSWRMVRWVIRCLLSKPLARRRPTFRNEEGTALSRLFRGVAYRVLFLPILIALTASAFVFSGTHPKPKAVELDPSSAGLYYDPVNFVSGDGTRLGGWLVPVISAKQVLEKKDKVLRSKSPAVVLVHDFGKTPQQMLPLLAPFHEDGIVTLTVALRGAGTGKRAGQTFGLRESDDVVSAVELLRRRPFVDPDRIAVLGIGTGATAAVRAASRDAGIKLIVLLGPPENAADVLAQRVGPQRVGLQWMRPFCKWAFEVGYSVDADEIALDTYAKVLKERAVLLLNEEGDLSRAREVVKLGLAKRATEQPSASAR